MTPSARSLRHRCLSTLVVVAAVLSSVGCSTSEPRAGADFCLPFEVAWTEYVDRRAGDQNPVASQDASVARRDALAARETLRRDWNALIEGQARPSTAVVESVRTLDRNLLTAWSGGGLGVRAQTDAKDSFRNGLEAVSAACARGAVTVHLESTEVPLTAPTTPPASHE